jgi:integrase
MLDPPSDSELVPLSPGPNHRGRYPQSADAGWILVPGKGALFAPRTIPLAFPSLAHFDEAVAQAQARMRKVEGLNVATVKWAGTAYKMFRRFLQSAAQHRERFLSGDLEAQQRILEAWIAWLRDDTRSSVTINNYWRGLSAVTARINRERGMVNPLVFLPVPKFSRRQPRHLTRDAAERVLTFVQHHQWSSRFEQARNLALIGFLLLAGMRRAEVTRLNFADVSVANRTIRIVKGKGRYGGKDRTCYMTPQLRSILGAYEAQRATLRTASPAYLLTVRGDRGISAAVIRHVLQRVSEALNLPVTPHALRHTYATLLRQSGVADRLAVDLMGHTSLEMLQRYSHIYSGELAQAVEKVILDVDIPDPQAPGIEFI